MPPRASCGMAVQAFDMRMASLTPGSIVPGRYGAPESPTREADGQATGWPILNAADCAVHPVRANSRARCRFMLGVGPRWCRGYHPPATPVRV
jgi:hypothetical protein